MNSFLSYYIRLWKVQEYNITPFLDSLSFVSLNLSDALVSGFVSCDIMSSQATRIFLLDIDITRERLLADKQQLQAIINNPNVSVKDKLDAMAPIFMQSLIS